MASGRSGQRFGNATRIIKLKSANEKPLYLFKPGKPSQSLFHTGKTAKKNKTLESDVLFIMNRLTPTNFERLAGEMRNLNIQSYEELTDLVKIFFDKVTMETKFVEAYAQLCKVMSSIKVPPPPGLKDSQSTFRVVMLTKCQQEFEADKSIIFEDPEEKKKKIEAEMPEGYERTIKIDAILHQMKRKRLKYYGNIRFIGELFKLGMLTENIMHDCIYRLLKARDDDSLVSLCQLLTTVGQVLDTDKAKTRMDQYFNQMAKIAEERKSRIKFTLKDAIDLRSNNWVPRKEQTGPKKIDEVHKDFQQEQYTKQLMQSQPPRTDTVQPNSRQGTSTTIIDGGPQQLQERHQLLEKSKGRTLSEKEIQYKGIDILREYLIAVDLHKAMFCLMELKGQAHLDILVSACINDVLEKSKQKRELTGQFSHEMVKRKLISLDAYSKGLSEVLQVAEDMVIDIPMIWSYLAQLIAPVLIGGSVPWSNLILTFKNNLDNRCCRKLLSEIVLVAKETKGENEAAHMWQISGLRWSMFMDEAEVEKFLQDEKLEFTLLPVKASLQSKTSQIIFERVTEDIERIAKDGGSNSDIFTYIEKNVPGEMQGNEFIRALTTAIASSSITTTKKPNKEAIKNCIKSHKDVLQHFIKSNVVLELQALYAIQALMHRLEHPSNITENLFAVLYDEDIISEAACKKWEKSTDPLEAEGKGACLMQLTQFFAWLKENGDPETS